MSNKKDKLKKMKIGMMLLGIILILLFILSAIIESHSREKIMNRLILGIDNLNYSINIGNQSIQILGKKEKQQKYENSITYIDYEKKITFDLYPESKYKEVYSNNGIEDMQYYQDFIKSYFQNDNYTYKYVGSKIDNGVKCYIVEFKDKYDVNKRYTVVRLWINSSLNVIEKQEDYIEYKKERTFVNEIKFNYHTNANTQSDVTISERELKEYSSDTNN